MTETEAYEQALQDTLAHEGGWYDGSQPHDPNPTMQGVTQQTYNSYRTRKELTQQSVRYITTPELREIYLDYWVSPRLGIVAHTYPLTAMCLFDMSINAGPVAAIKVLQRALGARDDGKFGPLTLESLHLHKMVEEDEHLALAVCMERIRYYADLCQTPRSKHRASLLGWTIRVLQFREKYLK